MVNEHSFSLQFHQRDSFPSLPDVAMAFICLLQRYSGQDRITVELRTETELDRLSLSVDFFDDPSFGQGLQRVRDRIENSGIATLPPGAHIEIMISPELQNDIAANSQAQTVVSNEAQPRFRLRVVCSETGLKGSLVYPLGRLTLHAISQMVQHFGILLEEVVTHPSHKLSEVQLLRGEERYTILEKWNDSSRGYLQAAIPELFTAQAHTSPGAIALIQGELRVTFYEVNSQANRLARYLRKCGVAPEVFVGMCFENSIRAIVTLLAILKAGGAYVPLDPGHPRERLREIVNDAGISTILAERRFWDRFPSEGLQLVDPEESAYQIAAERDTNFESGCDADSAAYAIYTSGSSGRPQGVVGIHRSISNGLHEVLFDPSRGDEVACLNGSMTVAFMILGIFLPLLAGVPLVILSEEEYRDPRLLAESVFAKKITYLALPTPALRQMLSLGDRVADRLRTVRQVQVGGALATADLLAAFRERFPWIQLRVAYGSSETGGLVTKGPAIDKNSIGYPAANARIYILDKYLNPVPIGVIGEIYVAAAHLARGYLNRPELTATRFLLDRFSNQPGARMFKTGDLARYLPDGAIEFLGRSDDQVKIRGYRVHLSEVESALNTHPAVREVVVSSREMENEQRLIAYAVVDTLQNPSASELRSYLRERLPEYMVPPAILFLDRFPMTASGKVDRQALPAYGTGLDERGTSEGPTTPTESFLVEVWSELLGNQEIGVHDSFLDVGGDSLFAVQIIARVWDRFRVDLPLAFFFERPTILELAAEIDGGGATARSAGI